MSKFSIAFVDDHPILLEGIASIFASDNAYHVVGKGGTAADALDITNRLKPNVLIVDLNMPGDTLEAMTSISQTMPETKIVAFTSAVGVDSAVEAFEAGASGYVLKGSSADDLRQAVRAVLGGETYITQSLAAQVILALRRVSMQKNKSEAIRLSVREEQIVNLLLEGRTNKEIGEQLDISVKTVKHYMTILMQKLHARNRLEVVLAAQKRLPGSVGSQTRQLLN
ncbi:response regulator [Phyllobacterium sp. SYP-B3895]|uniref:Response regulator transcription factor n=1 Tax=Phyllobacterium pellucidum TaxID=2740464 RepID=A0A849VXL1_9HYPH|nr:MULTISPECIES: response regulator transcription factor [Phyllobacterium]MRG57902.1 response regulator [Phyllobacterium sp. SYP-B3895]NTS33329.1 response regulator transcription factor [Phyllobacterium pellucidum]SFJ41599.1 DNA-binding response regulator, NarL/FixJ family, contains REC and HTH domains [Phyllobacterium sp. CL33Tsu]